MIIPSRTLRQIGALFVAGFVIFAVTVPFVFTSPMNTEVFAEQARLGVGVDGLPIEMYAEISRRHAVSTFPLLIGTLAGMVAFSSASIMAARRIAARPLSRTVIGVAGAGVSIAWLAAAVVDLIMMNATASWVGQHYYAVYAGVQAIVSGLASVSLLALGLELRRVSVLPRFGLVLAILSGLSLVGAILIGVPPVLGLLLGAILGVLLIRQAKQPAAQPSVSVAQSSKPG